MDSPSRFVALLGGLSAAVLGVACSGKLEAPSDTGSPAVLPGGDPASSGPGASGTSLDPTLPPVSGATSCSDATTDPLAGAGGETRIWRLNDLQYTNALRDLLPGVTVPEVATPGRDPNEFVSWDVAFPVQEAFASQLLDVAAEVGAQAVQQLPSLFPCASGSAERDCAAAFVDSFATRAFRRPLAPGEKDQLLASYDVGVATGGSHASGIELLFNAILGAPSFLYRTELGAPATAAGAPTALDPYETASALSFFLLSSIPDAPLWQTAVDGTLADPAIRAREVDRLLTLPQVRANLTRVVLSWLAAPNVTTVEKTEAELTSLTFDAAVRSSMLGEATRFVDGVLWNGGTLSDLFASRRAFVDATMASFYGITPGATEQTPVELPLDRAGLLTRAAVIASAHYGQNPEVFRGRLLRENILCGKMQAPPPTADIDAFNAQYAGLSTRERIELRIERPECGGCHLQMDPLGVAFDAFGALGQPVTQVNAVAPDPRGDLTGTDVDGPFANLSELSMLLAGSNTVAECTSQQMLTYALGRELSLSSPTSADACTRTQIAATLRATGAELADVFRMIAKSHVFTARIAGAL